MSTASVLFGDNANTSQTQTTTPTFGAAGTLNDLVLKMLMQRLSSPTSLAGYEAGGVSRINRTYDLSKQAQDNNLTARGLGTSPIAANVDATRELARAGDVAGFRNTVPLTQRALGNEDLQSAGQAISANRGLNFSGVGTGSNFNLGLGSLIGQMVASGVFGGTGSGTGSGTGGNGASASGIAGWLLRLLGGGKSDPLASRQTTDSFGFLPPGLIAGGSGTPDGNPLHD